MRLTHPKIILAVALAVFIGRVAGLHTHLCLHETAPKSTVHSLMQEQFGTADEDDHGSGPGDLEIDAGDKGVLKSAKLVFDLPLTGYSPLPVRTDVCVGCVQFSVEHPPVTGSQRELRPPLRGPPA